MLETRINIRKFVNQQPMGYKKIVKGHDKSNESSPFNVFILQQKSSYLCLSYTYALTYMNAWHWIDNCCTKDMTDLEALGYNLCTNP